MDWHCVFFKDRDGNEPVKDFILQQSDGAIAEILHVFDLLHTFGISLGRPFIEKVEDKIWAIRIKHSSDYYRIFYFSYSGKKFVLLHAVKKKSDKLHKSDISLAKSRMKDHEQP